MDNLPIIEFENGYDSTLAKEFESKYMGEWKRIKINYDIYRGELRTIKAFLRKKDRVPVGCKEYSIWGKVDLVQQQQRDKHGNVIEKRTLIFETANSFLGRKNGAKETK